MVGVVGQSQDEELYRRDGFWTTNAASAVVESLDPDRKRSWVLYSKLAMILTSLKIKKSKQPGSQAAQSLKVGLD